MWFVGMLLGLVVGAAVGNIEGAFYGAALGALAGFALRLLLGGSTDARLAKLEQQVADLRAALEAERTLAPAPSQAQARTISPGEASVALPFPEFEIAPEPTPAPASVAEVSTPTTPPASSPRAVLGAARPPERPAWLRWLLGGNTVVRVGIVVLFFGVAFLLKYAYEHTHVPIQARLIAVAAAAVALLLVGWRLRLHRPGYALSLQGGGIGVLYLTVFASLRLFGLLPPAAALTLLVLIAVLSAALAILQNSQSLAILGASGGFLAPILASTGGGNHVMLFSYYAVLNASILAVAWYRSWRPLNVVGFAFTFAIGAAWGGLYYRPELYASTQPFLAMFFLMYLAIPVLFAQREATRMERYVDATLVFGVPLIAFGLQLRLTRDFEYGAAFSALTVAFVYLLLARFLYTRHRELLRMLVEAFLALAVVFVTLAIPLGFDGRWTAAAWALEGAALVWVGVLQRRWLARGTGLALQLAAGLSFLGSAHLWRAELPVLNSFYLGCVLIAVAGLFSNWYLERHRELLGATQRWAATLVFFWGLVWWTGGSLLEIEAHARSELQPDLALGFFVASCCAFSLLWQRLTWRFAQHTALALMPLMALMLIVDASVYHKPHPFAQLGWVTWPLAFAAQLWLLRRHDSPPADGITHLHAGTVWGFAAVGAWQVAWLIDQAVAGQAVWPLIAWAVVPGALVLMLALGGERITWPVRRHLAAYLLNGAAPLVALLWCWVVYANVASDGDPAPLRYVPLLSPLDLAQCGALLVVTLWLRRIQHLGLADLTGERAALVYVLLGIAAFTVANGILLRTLHHWANVPYTVRELLRSMLVQTALSIFWSTLALAAMMIATRLRLRALWISGAILMGVVVVKLFLVELSNVGGVERIVSFIGVGLLMLLIGYVSPVPPRMQDPSR